MKIPSSTYHEHGVAALKDTVINHGLFESDGVEFINEVLVPYTAGLLLPIDLFEQFEHIILGVPFSSF
jgi:hypothetical protein